MQVFLHPNTVAKIQLVRGKKKIRQTFEQHFSPQLTEWLLEEIRRNKQSPLPAAQREFWKAPPPSPDTHDPRGCPDYVQRHVLPYKRTMQTTDTPLRVHNPHPNVIDALVGRLQATSSLTQYAIGNSVSVAEAGSANQNDDQSDSDGEQNGTQELEIADEYMIPENAASLHM